MSQMHVEVAVDRLKSRFGVEVDLHQPRVPYLETIRKESRARHRYKKQTGGRGQFGDCEIVLEPLPERAGYEFVDRKSTRLNSSHVSISYAVFCLKKKKKTLSHRLAY